MNKVILMSIRPEWLVKILNGEKTIEIRKSMPKCELPIDVYLYCTKGKPYLMSIFNEWELTKYKTDMSKSKNLFNGNSKVVAKFTLNKVEEVVDNGSSYRINNDVAHTNKVAINSCLDFKEMKKYLEGKNGFAWHIDNLVIFDKPKELGEFSIFKRQTIYCGMDCPPYTDWVEYKVRKAPQSWQYAYVEE